MKINQLNGKGGENSRKKLAACVNQAMGKQFDKIEYSLLNRLLKVTASDLLGGKATGAEERRIRWTSFRNLNQWFDNWGRDLVQLGFAHMEGNEIIIPIEQLARIVNVDETCLALDGGSGIRGGQPEIIYFGRNLPDVGKGFSKSSNTTTMITGSSAVGEAIPPHFQFTTAAQCDETKRLRCDIQSFMPKVRGKFGCEEERMWSMTYGMNAKGGMDEEEFDKYVFGSLVPLYPDAEDKPGK